MSKRYSDTHQELDPDRGGTRALSNRLAVLVPGDDVWDRAEAREGLRDLDARVEQLPGLTRLRKDRERINPRNTVAPVQHPRMVRGMPETQSVRVPFSSRQKKARSKTRRQVQREMSPTVYAAQRTLLRRPGEWQRVNDALSAAVGDVHELGARDQRMARRVDKAIQAYEQKNGRGHVIYTNVVMPHSVNHTSLSPFVERHFEPGDVIEFDRYSVGSHQLHEATRYAGRQAEERVAVFEISTRRGAYVGQSDSLDNTAHLLPRGMRLEVIGTQEGQWRAPDGTTGTRMIIQLRDITPEPTDTDSTQRGTRDQQADRVRI